MNILRLWNDYSSHRRDYRREIIKREIKTHLTGRRSSRWDHVRLDNIQNQRNSFNRFGASVGIAIRDQSISHILELANDSVRFQSDWIDFIEEKFPDAQNELFRCNDCNVIEHRDNSSRCYHDYLVCESCREDNYEWDEDQHYR
jgi:hypothetical protein